MFRWIVETHLVIGIRKPAHGLEGSVSDSPILFVGRRYVPVHRMDHSEIGDGGRPDRQSRQVLVCACGVSFSIGAPLPGCAWLAVLRCHADENSCKYRAGEVYWVTHQD